MALRAESLVIAADVGRTLSDDRAKQVLRIARSVVTNKVLYGGKNDSVCLLLFGATKTRNELHEEMVAGGEHDQYCDILVLKELSTVGPETLQALSGEDSLCWGGKSDHLDALTVAFDILCKEKVKSRCRILLVSDFMCDIKGVEVAFRDHVVGSIKEKECQLELVSLDPITPTSRHPQETKDLVVFLRDEVASLECASDVEDYASLREVKSFSSVCTAKLPLAIGNLMIPVSLYKKVKKAAMSTNLRASNFFKDEKGEVYGVHRETEYKKKDDKDEAVVTTKIKAYPYGKDLIPVDDAAAKFLSQKEERSFVLLGFKEREDVPHHLFLGEASAVLPEACNMGAQLAVSALVRAMAEMDRVAVVRCVSRNGSDPYLGALVPMAGSAAENVPDHFILCMLPFAEDIREFQFASLNASEKWVPSDKELGLAEAIMKDMSLVEDNGEGHESEALKSEKMANPQILNMNAFVAEKVSGVARTDWQEATQKNYLKCLSGPSDVVLSRAAAHLAELEDVAKVTVKKEEKTEVKKEEECM